MTSKIKLAFIITRLCSGGAVEAVKSLAQGLDRQRYEITLLYGQIEPGEVDVAEETLLCFDRGIELKKMRRAFSAVADHFATQEIQKHIREQAFDIVHTHTSKAGFLGRLAAHREKVKLIVHSTHGIIFNPNAEIPGVRGVKKWLFLQAEKMAARWCHRILTLSEVEIADWHQLKVGKKNQYSCLPSPVRTQEFLNSRSHRESLRQQWELSLDKKIVVLLGRLAEEKGHKYALEAMKSLKDIELWIVGEGPLKKEIEGMIISYDVGDRVKLLGHRKDVSDWLSLCDVLLLPSSYEGQGLVLIEALAAGLAVVATEVGGVTEIIQDEKNALLVEPQNAGAIVKALLRLTEEESLKNKLLEGTDKIIEKYSVQRICRDLERVYESC